MLPRTGPARDKLLIVLLSTLLFGATLLLFTPSLGCGFTNYDDPIYITGNTHLQHGFTAESLRWAFTGQADYWHPLTWLSHLVDWSLYGNNPAGHHLTSVLWHALNAVLCLLVFRRLTGSVALAALAAALFAWHPLRVESVTWITERKDVMSGAGFLLTLLAYLRYGERRRDGASAGGAYGTTLVCFAAGLMCKPSLVATPLLLLALDFWPLRRWSTAAWRGLVLEKLPFLALAAATAVVTIRMQQQVGAFTITVPLLARLANAPVAMARYIGTFLWPAGLSVCYPHPGWWPAWVIVGAVGFVSALTFLAWRWRARAPALPTGWTWFIVMLLPTLGLVQVGFQSMADRYTYLPVLGLELALVAGLDAVFRRTPRLVPFVAATGVLLAAAALSWRQQGVWRDPATLFEHAVAVTRRNDVAEAFLGYTLATSGQPDAAILHSTRALAINPRNQMAVYTLAGIHAARGDVDEAVAGYRRALELKPNVAASEYALGILLLRRGDRDEATTHLRRAVTLDPAVPADNLALAGRHAAAGRATEAWLAYTAAVMLTPDSVPAHLGLARTSAQLGQPRAAITEYRRALEIAPRNPAILLELGRLLTAGDPVAAGTCFQQAMTLEPTNADAARLWAEALARQQRFPEAISAYRHALWLRPDDPAAHAGLGYVLYLTGDAAAAKQEWREALRLDPAFPGIREHLGETR